MGISNHPSDAFERRNLFGNALRVASGNQDFGLRLLPADAADGRASVLIGRRSYRTGVENDDSGVGSCVNAPQTVVRKLAFDGRPIRLRRAASEVLNVVTSHSAIIAARRGASLHLTT